MGRDSKFEGFRGARGSLVAVGCTFLALSCHWKDEEREILVYLIPQNTQFHYLNLTVYDSFYKHMHTADISFEAMHDNFCYFLQASNRQECKFG